MKKDIYGRTKGKPCVICGGTEYPHKHSAPSKPLSEPQTKLDGAGTPFDIVLRENIDFTPKETPEGDKEKIK